MGEVLAAVGKIQRFGWYSVNPSVEVENQETNKDWLLRELDDLEGCITRLKNTISKEVTDN